MFFVNAIMMQAVKLFALAMCWSMAIFIAPVGLAYLYPCGSGLHCFEQALVAVFQMCSQARLPSTTAALAAV